MGRTQEVHNATFMKLPSVRWKVREKKPNITNLFITKAPYKKKSSDLQLQLQLQL
jgi:hypothetical protein